MVKLDNGHYIDQKIIGLMIIQLKNVQNVVHNLVLLKENITVENVDKYFVINVVIIKLNYPIWDILNQSEYVIIATKEFKSLEESSRIHPWR